jgi:hypothetical protein
MFIYLLILGRFILCSFVLKTSYKLFVVGNSAKYVLMAFLGYLKMECVQDYVSEDNDCWQRKPAFLKMTARGKDHAECCST